MSDASDFEREPLAWREFMSPIGICAQFQRQPTTNGGGCTTDWHNQRGALLYLSAFNQCH